MPAHAARRARAGRVAAYTTAGLVIAGVLLLFAGPQRARALVQAGSSPSPSAPTVAPSPVSDNSSATPAPKASPTRSGPYRVVGLGDSVPAGDVCDCTSYVDLVGAYEAKRQETKAAVSNLAEGGATTSDLLDQLKESSVRSRIAAADLVIVTIGANDFDTGSVGSDSCGAPGLSCFQSTLKEQKSQLDDVFKGISALLAEQHATVLVTGYWNVFLDGDVATDRGSDYVRNSIALTKAENDQIRATAEDHGATYVDIFTPFKGESGTRNDTSLLADDGDHPNAAGHRRIAAALESALT